MVKNCNDLKSVGVYLAVFIFDFTCTPWTIQSKSLSLSVPVLVWLSCSWSDPCTKPTNVELWELESL